MQAQGLPVTRDSILIKGNEIYQVMYGSTRSIGFLKRGWLNRFMEQHPKLSLRSAQTRSSWVSQEILLRGLRRVVCGRLLFQKIQTVCL